MHTLHARLSLALFLVVALTGGAFFLLEQYSARSYYEEITQRLNSAIAMYVTGEMQLIEGGVVNEQALKTLAQRAMVINPSVEVYLLDREGKVLADALPPGSVAVEHVDLAPVRALIAGKAELPLRGTDPRHPDRRKIFSAHPVLDGDVLQGYLYVVLGGQNYDELASGVRVSYVERLTLGAVAAIVLSAFLVGLIVFGLLTRRLARLTADVQLLADSGFDPVSIQDLSAPPTGGSRCDEIGRLRLAFTAMARKICDQFESLEENDRLRRELVGNVSHDLRTPLASMHGYVETLILKNDSLGPAERLRYLEIARRHTHRLRQLIGDLFELSRLNSPEIRPVLEDFSLAELLQDVTRGFELEAQQKGIRLRLEVHPSSAEVHADIALIQRVLENLLRNALKFTPAGGSVTVSVERHPDHVAVAVADTGRGIPEPELERVFEREYRIGEEGDAPGAHDPSAGLGLAIVKRILDLHGSRITVRSELNHGTRFEFEVPVRVAA